VTILKNILAIIGLIAVLAIGFLSARLWPTVSPIWPAVSDVWPALSELDPREWDPALVETYAGFTKQLLANKDKVGPALSELGPALAKFKFEDFDPEFINVYTSFGKKLLEKKDPGVAMMWAEPVEEGLTPEEVIESLKSVATERNFLFVGESPFYKQVEAVTGEPYRYANFLSFCDARVGKMMADYRDAYTGFMPCRIAVVENTGGQLWLYTLNLDLMIHGGKMLPPKLKEGALRVRNTIKEMMERAAKGEF
jgi:uncharacterized protein (DUF302 family)